MLGDVNISAILDSFSVSYDKRVRPNYGGMYYVSFLHQFLVIDECEQEEKISLQANASWYRRNHFTFLVLESLTSTRDTKENMKNNQKGSADSSEESEFHESVQE